MAWNICLVSDNEAIQHLFTKTFADRGDISVRFCATAKEAVREASTDALHLLIASATLPDKDGYDLCKELKDEIHVDFPVLLIEDIFEDIDLDRCLEVKTDGFIAKPFEEDLIAEKVDEVIQTIEKEPLVAEEEELTEMTSASEEEATSSAMLSSEEEEDIMDLTDLVGEEEIAASFIETAQEETPKEEPEMPSSITSALEESVSEMEKMEAMEPEEAFVFEKGIPEAQAEEEEVAPAAAVNPEEIEKLVNETVEKAVDEAVQKALEDKLPSALRKSLAKFLSDFSELLK